MSTDQVFNILYYILTYGIFCYTVILLLSYIFIGLYSIGETRKYLHKNSFTEYRILATSPHAPTISILAPAYNEAKTIVENVRSLLSVYYNNLELIIINDGSKDDSLQRLIEAYELEKRDFFVNYRVATRPVRAIYKSRNPVFDKLVVVDKENGGKADALNVGINIASNNYLICIDVDCVLEQDALLKMIKPFLEQTDERVIASGGVVRIANSCVIEEGRLVKVRMPVDYLPRMQSLEYIRAFILGRMAWSRLNGLMLISGAFGAFDREIVIRCGGYNTKTVGEDMELVVRMRRYMEETGQPYRVTYIPDPLCWTEAPDSFRILGRQRNRWTRGMIETLRMHRKMFFNPKYRLLGMLSYPYWLFFEMLSPLVEFFGFIFFLVFTIIGITDWNLFFCYLLLVICFAYLYSAFGIFMEVITYNQYRRRTDVLRLLLTSLTEPFYFHPFIVWSAIRGYWDLFKKKKGWGEMTRSGFSAPPAIPAGQAQTVQAMNVVPGISPPSAATTTANRTTINWKVRLYQAFRDYLRYGIILLGFLTVARIFELVSDLVQHGKSPFWGRTIALSFLKDLACYCEAALPGFLLFLPVYLWRKKVAVVLFVVLSILLLYIQAALSQYFLTTSIPLGADLWGYSWSEIRQTVGAAGGITLSLILVMAGLTAALLLAFIYIPRRVHPGGRFITALLLIFIASLAVQAITVTNKWTPGAEYSNNLSINKSYFFYKASLDYMFPASREQDIYSDTYSGDFGDEPTGAPGASGASVSSFHYIDEAQYPFLHAADTGEGVLPPFLDKGPSSLDTGASSPKATVPPNIVIVLVEGLGRAFTNQGAYLGNFTPFLDSLSQKSLYWENFLSEGGRTFAVLPSLTGSLPFGKNGFNELGANMPDHLSLISLLKSGGYKTAFYYGGDSHFDNMDLYLRQNRIDNIYDEASFPSGYIKMPAHNGFTWGYGDKELFRRYLSINRQTQNGGKSQSNEQPQSNKEPQSGEQSQSGEQTRRSRQSQNGEQAQQSQHREPAQPYLNILLTVSTHSPFFINEQDLYLRKLEQRMNALGLDEAARKRCRDYQYQFASILYMDDALRDFFSMYRARADFANTVFLITGDHRMPEIPMSDKLDRYHVPLILYSPLLKRTARFSSISTHFDITPSLLQWLGHDYGLRVPPIASWMGHGLDTSRSFRNIHAYPLMQTKNDLIDFISGNYLLNGNDLYRINGNLELTPDQDNAKASALRAAFDLFRQKNGQMLEGKKLIPDSLYQSYIPH